FLLKYRYRYQHQHQQLEQVNWIQIPDQNIFFPLDLNGEYFSQYLSPEFKYDIGFSPSRKRSETQAFIISNTLIFSTFVTTEYSNIRSRLENSSWNSWRAI
ncbi:hypothetical protein L9F63_013543, partial [Diploptera punctata]